MVLTKDQYETRVRERIEAQLSLRSLQSAYSVASQEHNTVTVGIERQKETVRLYKQSKDIHLEEAEALLKTLEGQKGGLPKMEKALADLKKRITEQEKIITETTVDIETTREVVTVFGEG